MPLEKDRQRICSHFVQFIHRLFLIWLNKAIHVS